MAQIAPQVQQSLADALTLWGVLSDSGNALFNNANAAERIATDEFNDEYSTCMDLTISDLEDNWKNI